MDIISKAKALAEHKRENLKKELFRGEIALENRKKSFLEKISKIQSVLRKINNKSGFKVEFIKPRNFGHFATIYLKDNLIGLVRLNEGYYNSKEVFYDSNIEETIFVSEIIFSKMLNGKNPGIMIKCDSDKLDEFESKLTYVLSEYL